MESFSWDQITKIKDLQRPRWNSSGDKPQVICARVTWSQDIKDSKGGNKFMKFLLRDETGMIEAVAVGEAVILEKKLDLLKVYRLSNFSLSSANTRYCNVHKFNMFLNKNTIVQLVEDVKCQPEEVFYHVDYLQKYFQTLRDSQWIDVTGKVLQPAEGGNGQKRVLIGSKDSDTGLELRLQGVHAEANFTTGECIELRQVLFQRKDGRLTLSTVYRTHIQRCGRKYEPKVNFMQGACKDITIKSDTNTDNQRIEAENKDAKFGRLPTDPLLAKLYLEALESGEEESNTIRVMVVGHKGSGKTTLVKKLLGNPGLEEPHDSTEGIDIHVHKCTANKDGNWIQVTESDCDPWMKRIASNSSSVSADSGLQTMDIDDENGGTFNSPTADKIQINNSDTKNIFFDDEKEDEMDTSVSYAHNQNQSSVEPSVSDEDLKEFKNAIETAEMNEHKTINIWDFAGQYIFYATHQLFLSSKAVYLLVVDLTKELSTEIHEEEGSALRNVSDFCEFWINSIYTYASTERGLPSILLVGTHSDHFDDSDKAKTSCDKLFNGINSPYISKQFITGHSENNTSDILDETENLRNSIVNSSSLQSESAIKIPKRWIPLEKQLMKQKESKIKYLAVEDVWNWNKTSNKPLKTMENVQAFLSYHHNLGTLVYFHEKGLSDWVVLDPKWIIDAFTSIVTTTRFFERRCFKRLDSIWAKVNETAKINENDLFEKVWKPIPEFYKNRKWLLQVMQRLHMIARLHRFDDETNCLTEQNTFIIPSFLANRRCNNSDIKKLYKLEKSTHTLSFHLEKSLVSPTVYYHLVATAIEKWEPYEKRREKHLLFDSLAVFKLDTAHIGIVERCSMSINISVKNLSNQRVDVKLCDKFRRCIESSLKTKLRVLSAGKDGVYKLEVKCGKHYDPNDEIMYHDFDDLKTHEQFVCLECDSSDKITFDEVMKQWFPFEDWVYGFFKYLSDKGKETYVVDEDLLDIVNAIQDNWEILAICLGFKIKAIDRIAIDSKNLQPICILNMLQECLMSNIQWGHLIFAIDEACQRGLTVNSDRLRDCLERIQ